MNLQGLYSRSDFLDAHDIDNAKAAIENQGYTVDDFGFGVVENLDLTNTDKRPASFTLYIKYLPTSVLRSYHVGSEPHWSTVFENDLSNGAFKHSKHSSESPQGEMK